MQATVKLGQVTPSITSCTQHRSGPTLAVALINGLNGGRGFLTGINNVYTRFALSSVEAPGFGDEGYETSHYERLMGLIHGKIDLLIGSCSPASANESIAANAAGRIIMAQVGPNDLYQGADGQPAYQYLFGIHLSSYRYSEPILRAMSFRGARTVAVVGRQQSLFFRTTCDSAVTFATSYGLKVLARHVYQAAGIDSRIDDLSPGSEDWAFHHHLARNISRTKADIVLGCMGADEANIYIAAWRGEGYSPKGAFFTCTTWGWPGDLPARSNPVEPGLSPCGCGFPHRGCA